MGIEPKDNEVLQLLKKIKDANGTYPQELLAARRQGYLKQVAQISGGAGLAVALKETVKHPKGTPTPPIPPVAGTLLEGLLVVAIVVEASAVAYFYRGKLTELFNSITGSPKVEEVSSPPALSSPIPGLELTPSPVVTLIGTETETATPVETPSLMAGQPTSQTGAGSSGSVTQAVSTANPSNGSTGNNGNQYGLTPKPERTKDPGGNTNSDGTTNDNNGGNSGNPSDPKKNK